MTALEFFPPEARKGVSVWLPADLAPENSNAGQVTSSHQSQPILAPFHLSLTREMLDVMTSMVGVGPNTTVARIPRSCR